MCNICSMDLRLSQLYSSIKITMPVFLTACVSLTVKLLPRSLLVSSLIHQATSGQGHLWHIFWPGDLDLWPTTLTFELDLDILPLDLHTKNEVCVFVRSALRVVTDAQTDTQTMSKLLHPSLTRGVKISLFTNLYTRNSNTLVAQGPMTIFFPHISFSSGLVRGTCKMFSHVQASIWWEKKYYGRPSGIQIVS